MATWVNSYKLLKDQPHKLQVDDNVFFGQANAHGLLVKDLTRPENMLLAVESSGDTLADSPIILSDFNILPSEEQGRNSLILCSQ